MEIRMEIMKQENLIVVKNFLQHQKNAQLDQALALIDDAAIWHSDSINAPWSGTHQGKKAIMKHFANIRAAVSSFKKTPFDLVASESTNFVYEYVYLECTFQNNHEHFATHLISIYEVKNGKIILYRVLEDSNHLYQAYHKTSTDRKLT